MQINHTNGDTGERIKNVLREWYQSPQSMCLKQGEELEDIIITDLQIIDQGKTLTSSIARYSVDCILSISNKNHRREHERIVLKRYHQGELTDVSTSFIERDRVILEGEVLTFISQGTDRVPRVFRSNREEIWMNELDGHLLSERIDTLDGKSIRLLKKVANPEGKIIFRSQITEKFGTGTIDILNELNKRGYLSIEASGEISLAPRFFDVFDITGSGDFKEKTKYFEEKNDLFEKGIDVLMEIQKVGNTCIKQLEERGITSPDIEHMYKRDITYLDGVMRYGRRKYKTSQRVEDLPKTEIRRVERAINYLNEQIAKLPGEVRYNFLQGDAHNGNMITRFGTVSVFDFFHAHLGVWLSDVVDFVTYNELFSNLEHPETFYGKALAKRLEFTENPVIFQLRYAKALEFMTIKRALRAGGALSWILSGEGAYMEEHERMREHLEQRREAYATFLREKLEENSRLKVLADYINP